MSPPILSLALPSATGRVLSIQSHTVQVCSIVYEGYGWFGINQHKLEIQLVLLASMTLLHEFPSIMLRTYIVELDFFCEKCCFLERVDFLVLLFCLLVNLLKKIKYKFLRIVC